MASQLDQFLGLAAECIQKKDGQMLRGLIVVDFDSIDENQRQSYQGLNKVVLQRFPDGGDNALDEYCRDALAKGTPHDPWNSFTGLMVVYLRFVRDYLTYSLRDKLFKIKDIANQSIIALGDTTYGVLILPTVLYLSRVLARIATESSKNPSLIASDLQLDASSSEGAPRKVTFVEESANILREAFIKCLAGGMNTRLARLEPTDKRIGVYLTANSCLKLLFQARKIRNAQQLFLSIDAQSPPLSHYPAAQRVTYLYYLGRYHFANNHFSRAQRALQSAYNQCHRDALSHRRLILIYLIASNICLGRFPSSELLLRRESKDIASRFIPLCKIISQGNLGAFHQYLDLNESNETAQWFLHKRILLQIRNRCEILAWRSLIRKTFILAGYDPGENRTMPYLKLPLIRAAAKWALQQKYDNGKGKGREVPQHMGVFNFVGSPFQIGSPFSISSSDATPTQSATGSDSDYIDPEFADLSAAIIETGFDIDSGIYYDESIGQPVPDEQTEPEDEHASPTKFEVESIVFSLIQQGLLRGFVTHTNPRFAIPGAKAGGGALAKGFPGVWEIVSAKEEGELGAPGWVRDDGGGRLGMLGGLGQGMGGRVVRLSGARPAGAGTG